MHDYSDQFELPVERLLESQVEAAGSQSGQDEMIGIASISMAKHIGRMAGNASVGQIVGHVSSGRNVCSMGQVDRCVSRYSTDMSCNNDRCISCGCLVLFFNGTPSGCYLWSTCLDLLCCCLLSKLSGCCRFQLMCCYLFFAVLQNWPCQPQFA